jgi:hypothetical protein
VTEPTPITALIINTARGRVSYAITQCPAFDGVYITRSMRINGAIHQLLIDRAALREVGEALIREADKCSSP